MIIQFMQALNDIVIRRYDQNRNIIDKFRVTMVYAPKQRVVFDLVNKSQQIILPVVSVSIGGVQRDNERVYNKLDGSYYNPDTVGSNVAEHLRQPLPVDITVNVSILTRYQADLDQIITNFIPYFDPYIVIQWRVPVFGHRINTPVYWSQSVNLTYPTEINADQPYHVTADTTFTIKGWLFKAIPKGVEKIYTIYSNYTSVKDLDMTYIDLSTDLGNTFQTDNLVIYGRPQPVHIFPHYATVGEESTYTLFGDSFRTVNNVFLTGYDISGNNLFDTLTAVDLFSSNNKLSATYPAFSATPVTSFTLESNNKLTFTIPAPIGRGFADVVLVNEGGYSSLRKESDISLLNPYPSGSQDFLDYISPKSPSVSGILIV